MIDYESDSTESTDSENENSEENSSSEYEDDDSGWITPDNLLELKRSSNRCSVEETPITVGCLTTDYAIQVLFHSVALV